MRREKPEKNKACRIGRSAQALLLCSPSATGGDVSELIVREGYALSAELVKLNSVLPNGWVFHEAENVAGFAKGHRPDQVRFEPPAQFHGERCLEPERSRASYQEYKQKFGRP